MPPEHDQTGKPSPERLADLRRRLGRLGVTAGRAFSPRTPEPGRDIHELVEGELVETDHGTCFRVAHLYPPDHRHGSRHLGDWHDLLPVTLADLAGEPALAGVDPHNLIFIDTETTGLGGMGTLAFEVGVARFAASGALEVYQFFLRDPAEEPAMLSLLDDLISPGGGLVTFNGRAFDVPLLAGRYIMNRRPPVLESLPHLDLLMPARRLWRRRLQSCSLSSLEARALGIRRTQDDVPGYLIPMLYNEYLRTRDAREMRRVLYHNEIDLLSMVVLAAELGAAFRAPDDPTLHIEDRLSLARWYLSSGDASGAESAYRTALEQAPDVLTRQEALEGLASLLKRSGHHADAVPLWVDLADLKQDVHGHVELAKYYEWHAVDFQQALHWTEQGIALAQSWRPGLHRTEALRELNHRRKRLLNKYNGLSSAESGPAEE